MAQLGKAYIEVHADTRPFGRELQGEIEAYLKAAEAQSKAGGERSGRNFSEGFSAEAKKGLTETGKEFEKFGAKVEKVSRSSGKKIRTELKKGLDGAERDTKTWASRVLSYFTSWALNGVSNFQGFASAATKSLDGVAGSAGALVGVIAGIIAIILILIPLVDALAGAFLFGGVGAFIAIAVAMSPVLLAFKEMSKILPVLTGNQKDFNKQLGLLNPQLRPIALVLREIGLAIKNLPFGSFARQLVPALQTMANFFKSKQFREGFRRLASDAGQLLSYILGIFETPAMGQAFFLFLKTISTIMGILQNVTFTVGKTLADVFNNPAVQKAVADFARILGEVVIRFANWLDQASKDGSLKTFLNDALTILGDVFLILQNVAGLFASLATPENMKSLHDFLLFVATALYLISGYLKSKEGQRFMHDLYVGAEFLIAALVTMVIILAAIDSAWYDIKYIGSLAWKFIKNAAIVSLNTIVGYLNAVISALNVVIGLVNTLSVGILHIPKIPHVPTIGGGKKGGPDTGHQGAPGANTGSQPATGSASALVGAVLSAFADGGVITSPTLALMGERSRPEVVIPLTQPNRARQLAEQSGLTSMLHRSNSITVQVDLDGQPFYQYTARALDAAGKDLLTGPRS